MDHEKVLAHYGNVVKQHQEVYQMQPLAVEFRRRETQYNECQNRLQQLTSKAAELHQEILQIERHQG
jgi:hypothetical protein